MKFLATLLIFNFIFTGQFASAAESGSGVSRDTSTYYIDSEEEEIREFNRAMATNKNFSLVYVNPIRKLDKMADLLDAEYSITEYSNSAYAYFNMELTYVKSMEISDKTLKVDFDIIFHEKPEETAFVYDTVRRLIRNNPEVVKASNYDKVVWAYNWICNNVKYDFSLQNNSAYKGLTDTTVCSGYANLFYVFAVELGLDSYIVNGLGNGTGGWGPHAWNAVKLEGGWYFVDTTWGSGQVHCLLRAKQNVTDHKLHKSYDNAKAILDFDATTSDYVNTGNSGQNGVLGSVFNIQFDPLKKNNLGVNEEFKWLINNPDKIELTFASKDEKIATVSSTGIIKAVGLGTTTISVINDELGIEQSFTVVVDGDSSINVRADKLSLKYGKTKQIKLNVYPTDAKLENVKYKSKNKSIATVNKNGKVTGKRVGTTTIVVTYNDNEEIKIKVTVKPLIKYNLLEINKGAKYSLRDAVKISPNGYKDLTFKSSNKKLATVSSTGMLKTLKSGKCKISVYDKISGKKVETITVTIR
jgi:hypothetical protein